MFLHRSSKLNREFVQRIEKKMDPAIAKLASSIVCYDDLRWQFNPKGQLIINDSSLNGCSDFVGEIISINRPEEIRTALQMEGWIFYLEPLSHEWIIKGWFDRSELTFPYRLKDSPQLNLNFLRCVGLLFRPILRSVPLIPSTLCSNGSNDRTTIEMHYRVKMFGSPEC